MAQDMDFMEQFIASHSLPQEALDHFSATPWTAPILQNALYEPIPTFSRILKPNGEDYFFSETTSTPTTIPHMVTLRLRSLETARPSPSSPSSRTTETSHKIATKVPENPDTLMLLNLGRPGIDGHPGVVHGGMLCAILDEMMGLCVMLHTSKAPGPRQSLFTAKLEVTYRAAVPTPSDVLVRCWVAKTEGRKWWSVGQVVNQDGLVMTEANGLWVTTKRKEVSL